MEELKDYEERDNPYAWVHPAEPPSRSGLKYSPQPFRRLAAVYTLATAGFFACMGLAYLTDVVTPNSASVFEINGVSVNAPLWLKLALMATVITMFITPLVLVYRCFAIIQGTTFARTQPGMAVIGFFIPIFNLYWIFAAFVGLARDMNGYCRWKEIEDGNSLCQVPVWLAGLVCATCLVVPVTSAIFENQFTFGPSPDVSTVLLMIPLMYFYALAAARIQEDRLRER